VLIKGRQASCSLPLVQSLKVIKGADSNKFARAFLTEKPPLPAALTAVLKFLSELDSYFNNQPLDKKPIPAYL